MTSAPKFVNESNILDFSPSKKAMQIQIVFKQFVQVFDEIQQKLVQIDAKMELIRVIQPKPRICQTVLLKINNSIYHIRKNLKKYEELNANIEKCRRNDRFEFENQWQSEKFENLKIFQFGVDENELEAIEQDTFQAIFTENLIDEMKIVVESQLEPEFNKILCVSDFLEIYQSWEGINNSGFETQMESTIELMREYTAPDILLSVYVPDSWENFKIFTMSDFYESSPLSWMTTMFSSVKHEYFYIDALRIELLEKFKPIFNDLKTQYQKIANADYLDDKTAKLFGDVTYMHTFKFQMMKELIPKLNELYPKCITVQRYLTKVVEMRAEITKQHQEEFTRWIEEKRKAEAAAEAAKKAEEAAKKAEAAARVANEKRKAEEEKKKAEEIKMFLFHFIQQKKAARVANELRETEAVERKAEEKKKAEEEGKRKAAEVEKRKAAEEEKRKAEEAAAAKAHSDRVKLLALIGVSSLSLPWVMNYAYNRLKHYYAKRKMWSKLEKITPKPMWILIQPFSSETLTPLRISKIKPENMYPYDVVYDIVTSILNIPNDSLVLKRVSLSKSKHTSRIAPTFGFQTNMTVDLLPEIRNLLIVESNRQGLVTDELLELTQKETDFYMKREQIYLPVLV